MKPELIMLGANHGNKQYLIGSDEEEFNNIKTKLDFQKAGKKEDDKDQYLGKRTYTQTQNLMKAEEEDIITERELKQGIQAKKNAYKKFADYMVRNEKLEDYFLQIDQDKALLVNIYFLNLKSLNFVIE